MSDEDGFEPHLGLIRALGSGPQRSYLSQVLKATALAGGVPRPSGRPRFTGSRIGRGGGIARLLSTRDRYAAYRQRRVIVKFSLPKLTGKGLAAARRHLRYVQRDGVTRDGQPGRLYSAEQDRADGKAFIDRTEADGDTRQFRFIVSPEDGDRYDDLKPLTRRLMTRMEEDLDTKLDWVAVDHFNTGHPHTHIIVRGRDDLGGQLIIAREYLTQGLRERAAELVALDLGPRSDWEIETRLRSEVEQERLTSLDRTLLRDQEGGAGLVRAEQRDPFRSALLAGRLQKLQRLGLAEPAGGAAWRLAPDLETTLRRMGERGDILKTLHRDLTERGLARAAGELSIYDAGKSGDRPLVGRLVRRGLEDELKDRQYLVIDGLDGRAHYVAIGKAEAVDLREGVIVSITANRAEPRPSDRTVADIAAANGGRYSIDIHLRHDPNARAEFAEAHVRRLEALRRLGGGVEREPDGTFVIAPDHLARMQAFEQRRLQDAPVQVQALSPLSLEAQLGSNGLTWLDRQLVGPAPEPTRDTGFGREVRDAVERRRLWLIEQGLAKADQTGTRYRANLLETLLRRDLSRVAGQLSDELGLGYVEARPGARIEGVYRRAVDLGGGRFAVIERSRDFTLVPWRPVLERSLGKPVSGVVRGDGMSWSIGRQRGGPSIS
jgi:type IV secretory pathway VirD2 relaxase